MCLYTIITIVPIHGLAVIIIKSDRFMEMINIGESLNEVTIVIYEAAVTTEKVFEKGYGKSIRQQK